MTITGTAADTAAASSAGVEVSVDGGATWHAAQGTVGLELRVDGRRARLRDDPQPRASTTAATSKRPAPASP